MIFAVSGTTWEAFDGDTGTPLFNVTNIPSGVTAARWVKFYRIHSQIMEPP